MKSERERLDTEIKSLSSKLEHFPSGKLICNRNGNRYKWYHSDGHTWTYIPKKKKQLAELLAMKTYMQYKKEYLEEQRNAVERYLKVCPKADKSEQLLLESSGYQELLRPYFLPENMELEEWMHAEYESNLRYPEKLTQKTAGGTFVRSKSEAMIDMALRFHKIPFRYECLLELNGVAYYPDFTIRHPKTGNIIYWEHFGMADDAAYSRKICSKLQIYMSHGLIPNRNLITTYETLKEPLNMEIIESIIRYYFL